MNHWTHEWTELRGPYGVRFARTPEDREAAQRLRFAVFSQELGAIVEGGERELDIDPIDEFADHLMVYEKSTDRCVGTYRLAISEQVDDVGGFYSSRIFDLGILTTPVLGQGIELGRACVDADHRTRNVFRLLLRGIGAYWAHSNKRYLFGCGSVPIDCPSHASAVVTLIDQEKWLDASIPVEPRSQYAPPQSQPSEPKDAPDIPALLSAYCSLGARLAASPAYDPDFRTLDFFVLLDKENVNERAYARYCKI